MYATPIGLRYACCDLFLFGVQQCFHARLCLELVHRAAPVQASTCKHVNTSNALLLNIFSPHPPRPWGDSRTASLALSSYPLAGNALLRKHPFTATLAVKKEVRCSFLSFNLGQASFSIEQSSL